MTQKKAAASAKGRAKAAKKKNGVKRRKLTPRQTLLLKGMVEGNSVRQAALAAGYSERSANHASELLSTEAMRAELQRRLSLDKIIQRIDEGMDATQSQVVVTGRKGGEHIDHFESPNYFERRSAAALAAKLIGADPSTKIEVKGDLTQLVKVTFVEVAAVAQP